jgi:SAM-dependent MidA family methyltransferase
MPVTIAEIGPGRGTLMKDMLRTLSRLDPSLASGAAFAMIETSPRLVDVQKRTLGGTPFAVAWHETIDTLGPTPLLIVGNELFDAVPIRQFVRAGTGWRERMVGLDEANGLGFFAGAGSVDPTLLPVTATEAPQGAIVEIAPARAALMATIAERISSNGGAGLFVDYGHLEPGVGDTLQALRRHGHEDVLANPGEADLTSHVDFAALATVVQAHGLEARLATQGDFLLGMGILERAGRLGAEADQAARDRIADAVERLAGPQAMGELFKVLAVLPRGAAARLPATMPFAAPDRFR